MKVLFAAAEAKPYYKTGGLAEVARSLPDALRARELDVRIILPHYPEIQLEGGVSEHEPDLLVPWPHAGLPAGITVHRPGAEHAPAVLLKQRAFFNTKQPYGAPGEEAVTLARRYAFFARAVVAYAARWGADVIHLNDWQTALAPVYALTDRWDGATVMGIHNLPYQGNFPPSVMRSIDLPPELFRTENGVEFHGHVSFLKGGIALADRIVTVSPTYAREVQTPEFGAGLDGLLRFRRRALYGILNGIMPAHWDPATDRALPKRYSDADLSGKSACRTAVLNAFGLEDGGPLFVMATRLAHQKGVNLLLSAMPQLLEQNVRLAVLGDGGPEYAHALQEWERRAPGRVAARFEFEDGLSHRMYAGGDFFLMPSLYEPCGLGQMIAQRYGTVPVVRRVGGLADTVQDGRTGFTFDAATPEALSGAVARAAAAWQVRGWVTLQKKCMRLDRSWKRSARDYEQLYRLAIGRLSA